MQHAVYLVNDARELSAALNTAERGTLPDATSDELERPGLNGLAGLSDTDNRADTPALVAGLKSGPHSARVTYGRRLCSIH